MYQLLILFLIVVLGCVVPSTAQEESINDFEIITPENANELTEIYLWESVTENLPLADFSPDGELIALALNDGLIQFISPYTSEIVNTIPEASVNGEILRFSSDGERIIIRDFSGIYSLWDVETGDLLASNNQQMDVVWFSVSQNLHYYYTINPTDQSGVYNFHISDIVTGEDMLILPSTTITAPNPDGSRILYGNPSGHVFLFDIERNAVILELSPITNEISNERGDLRGLGFTPDGNIWVNWQFYGEPEEPLESYSPIIFYDESGLELYRLVGEHLYHRLYFDYTNTFVVSVQTNAYTLGGDITVWNRISGEQVNNSLGDALGKPLTLSPVSNIFAIPINRQHINIYAYDQSSHISSLEANETWSNLEFNSRGNMLLNVGFDIRLWAIEAEN